MLKKTNGRQEPFVYGSLSSKGFYFSKAPVATPVAPKEVDRPVVKNAEFLFWESVKGSRDPADLKAYLEQFPRGAFAKLAHNRLKRLSNPQVGGESRPRRRWKRRLASSAPSGGASRLRWARAASTPAGGTGCSARARGRP